MSREWKSGDVAMVGVGCHANRHVGMFDGVGWRYADGIRWAANDPAIVTARPLVVIDPEDREQVERLWRIWTTFAPNHRLAQDNLQAALREYADPKPPKPEEPTGLGAVVEDAEGRRWTRYRETTTVRHWHPADGCGTERRYAEIDGVKVLSEGVL